GEGVDAEGGGGGEAGAGVGRPEVGAQPEGEGGGEAPEGPIAGVAATEPVEEEGRGEDGPGERDGGEAEAGAGEVVEPLGEGGGPGAQVREHGGGGDADRRDED